MIGVDFKKVELRLSRKTFKNVYPDFVNRVSSRVLPLKDSLMLKFVRA